MKSTGIVRRIDELGRIVVPIEMRRALDILPAVWLSSALSVTAGLACARVLGRVWRT